MKAILNFKQYEIEEINYKVNTLHEVEELSLEPLILCNVYRTKDNNSKFIIKLGLEFGDETLKTTNSFLKCVVTGVFEQEAETEIDLTPNAVAILFPYLRSLISDVTSKGSRDPIILPPINVNEFLEQSETSEEDIEEEFHKF
ncbi:protein-export chaperone SecB [Macrococcoides caseolyticum]|uniref:protein-export chaperone SecB n=1 Tax=Macrococcoides caseolyticum TaxID=69966 RepID=UPI001C5F0790|nr:protein-export chaperone SecB [Macrococcus caseolyticus]QYA35002.1 protein-export chaperone SecB [Macrococcus caseolyticus]